MGGERRERILNILIGRGGGAFGTKRLCQVCTEATGTSDGRTRRNGATSALRGGR